MSKKRKLARSVVAGIALLAASAAMPATAKAANWLEMREISLSAQFAPPHNEPVLVWDTEVARYRVMGEVGVRFFKRLDVGLEVSWWGTNPWRTMDEVGHDGFPNVWRRSDWSWHRTRYEQKVTAALWLTDKIAMVYEGMDFHWPDNDGPRGGTYYHIVGFKVSFLGKR